MGGGLSSVSLVHDDAVDAVSSLGKVLQEVVQVSLNVEFDCGVQGAPLAETAFIKWVHLLDGLDKMLKEVADHFPVLAHHLALLFLVLRADLGQQEVESVLLWLVKDCIQALIAEVFGAR